MFRSTCALIRSTFSNQTRHTSHQYQPKKTVYRKAHKGKVPIPSGGSTKGTTIQIGDYGLRLKGEGKRLSAKQLQTCEAVIRRVIKVEKGARAFLRPACNIAVCRKGNETRMGKGKGEFDHWAVRVPVGRIVWEIGGASEELAREAFRQAGNKLPGLYEFVKKGASAKVGTMSINLDATEMVLNEETNKMEMVR
ncbi:54S ribosomal protein L16,mitochondrial [Taphrina deformans PYCC 5710]|uniref:54S ribosomal protein L16,mitochondrial n=1 Tax=Taphrina deformans (strain PYCC 5710 / ATCC 11124 / CBS 356.35 / IMI 108563 / JCM 9778 / NBRC 8474) TaxID=1097556 RepID=R4X6E3_TAPDE|nr:54S ribosomal protein L16,mitochondrial [Taphrina deformans PYCC 5710]|eukprot:CCG80644.1 54S ribosomal protein L16,mitochondrial [Taphrina deformans PYCC 5710]